MGIRERKKREKERREQQIIVAAGRVFSRKGFNQAVMSWIWFVGVEPAHYITNFPS